MCPDALPLAQLLPAISAGPTLGLAQEIARLTALLPQWCAEPWVRHLRVANLRDPVLVIYSASAAALVPFRGHQDSLLVFVNRVSGRTLTRIETRVRPPPLKTSGGV